MFVRKKLTLNICLYGADASSEVNVNGKCVSLHKLCGIMRSKENRSNESSDFMSDLVFLFNALP